MFWGYSEALNLVELYQKNIQNDDINQINILLYGCGDPRHIIKTLSQSFHGPNIKINFYMVEGVLEILARNLLLTTVALENPENFSLTRKTHLYMDIFGNALTRPITHNYICSKAKNFIKMITDEDYAAENFPFIKFDLLKYRERDGLENIFLFWLNKVENIFNMPVYWETRLRGLLKTRYDHRKGAFDWDLMMCLKDRGATQICGQEYAYWRETGIAFTFPEFEYNAPNKTFGSGLVKNGSNYKHHGYVGDMIVGPYAPFGIRCNDCKMLASSHGTNQFRSTDVTFRNLYELFFEIHERKSYIHDGTYSPAYGTAKVQNSKIYHDNVKCDIDLENYEKPLINFMNFTLNFISLDDVIKIGEGRQFHEKFDVIFVAQNYFPLIKESFKNIFAEKLLIIFETRQISLLKKEDVAKFLAEIKSYAIQVGLEAVTKCSVNKPFNELIYKRNKEI